MNKFQRLQCVINSQISIICYKFFYHKSLQIGGGRGRLENIFQLISEKMGA